MASLLVFKFISPEDYNQTNVIS